MARLASSPNDVVTAGSAPSAAAGAAAPSALSLATLSDHAGIAALRAEWRALFAAAGRPQQVFQTVEWLALWAAVYAAPRTRLAIVTARRAERLVVVWPLVVQAAPGLRILTGMGEPLSQYTDALVAEDVTPAELDAVFDHVLTLGFDVASFRRVRDDAALAPLLLRRLGPAPTRQASPVVDFTDTRDAAAFERRFPGKLRGSRRRRRRRLEERGVVAAEVHAAGAPAARAVAAALAFKREWAQRHHVTAPALKDPRFERFFLAATAAGPEAPDLRILELRCGAERIGVSLSVAAKGRLFGHVLAPDPSLEAFGIGGLLAEATILDALENGYDAIDLLAPADGYKLEWTQEFVGVGDYAFARSIRGALYRRVWLRWGRGAAKRALAVVGRWRGGRRAP